MKRGWIILVLVLVCALSAALAEEGVKPAYDVTVPAGYEEGVRHYPVLYLLPEDGCSIDESGLAEQLTAQMEAGVGMKMIIVRPAFAEKEDVTAAMRAVVAEIDGAYRTVAAPECRMALGTGTGGYLAYILLLEENSPFGAAASIRGDFASEANPWLGICGSVREKLEALHAADENALNRFDTYMDAPVDDPWSDLPGSTNDLGALMIGYGTGSQFHEYTVRPGSYDEAFAAESVKRVLKRTTGRILSGIVSGRVELEKTTLTKDDAAAKAMCCVEVSEAVRTFSDGELALVINVELQDPGTGESLSAAGSMQMIPGPGTYPEQLELANTLKGSSGNVRLSVSLLDTSFDLASTPVLCVQDPVIDGDFQQIELLGDWYFTYTGMQTLDAASLQKTDFEAWSVVQPGLAWWEKGFGNISDENVKSGYGPDYFNYFITGSGYYARTFTVPETFDAENPVLSVGYVDDRCEVYLNGQKIGATGLDGQGAPTGDTTWAVFSHFAVDPSLLNLGGENTVVVRAWNDMPFGAGGWYAGPIGLYSQTAFDAQYGESASARFYEESFASACAARANGREGTVENQYLIYLPESYASSDRYYPAVYLLHQFNSDHTSYRTDHVDALLDAGIRAGLFDEMIVVIPNSSEESWWKGEWEKMITDELIPLIESRYRAIPDARYRLTAGCSMGGQGAYAVALRNPDLFTGAVSFFGAFSYGGESDPNRIAEKESADYLKNYALYFICGNQDSYGFGIPAITLHQKLKALGVEHAFLIDNGGHDSSFYVPFFQEALSYARGHMYRSDEMSGLFSGVLTRQEGGFRAELTADPGVAAYLYTAPASSYTKLGTQPLKAVLLLETVLNGENVVFRCPVDLNADNLTAEAIFDPIETDPGAAVTLKLAVLDQVITLATTE